jgi:SAM-dependent methyltransferase
MVGGARQSRAMADLPHHGRHAMVAQMTDTPSVKRLAAATSAWRAAPDDREARTRLAVMLWRRPDLADASHLPAITAMIRDPAIDPAQFERAGWVALGPALPDPVDPRAAALWLERDDLAIALIEETQVADAGAERLLSAVRRWLLLDRRTAAFPRLAAALVRQAAINGGAWPFDAEERAVLAAAPDFLAAYLPEPPDTTGADFAAPVTRAVAAQYGRWPYPVCQRANATTLRSLGESLRACGPDAPTLPDRPNILVAGCGTGREAMNLARLAPDATVTAIELSDTSLAVARARCAGQGNLRFLRHDLHTVAELGQRFDYIVCSGVLHHLSDPEAGWAVLVDVLAPGGAMQVALYSRIARLPVTAARMRLGTLMHEPVSDDLIREARNRLIAARVPGVTDSRDFFSTAGVHDLLFHVHEDCFDVPRIERAIDALGLKLLRFGLPTPEDAARYRDLAPHDPLHRDFAAWQAYEMRNPSTFAGMYKMTLARAS